VNQTSGKDAVFPRGEKYKETKLRLAEKFRRAKGRQNIA
jgi:hypothetical protein